jgi:hypothetical protein
MPVALFLPLVLLFDLFAGGTSLLAHGIIILMRDIGLLSRKPRQVLGIDCHRPPL